MSGPALIGSIFAILALALIARLLKLGGGALTGADDAMRCAQDLLPGFEPTSAVVGVGGQAAVVFGDEETVFVRRHGAHFVARRLPTEPAIHREWTTVTINHDERLLGTFAIQLESEAEARELTRMLGSES